VTRALLLLALLVGCNDTPGVGGCYGVCGEGTVCRAGMCVVAGDDAPAGTPAETDDEAPTKSGKRRRGSKKGSEALAAEDPGFTPVDDSRVPEYDANKTQVIDMKAGTERIDDEVVRAHLRRLEPAFNRCIETAAQHSDADIGGGEVDFAFGIAPSGKVEGVTVKAPPQLRVFGIVPCLRRALADHRFPAFDGSTMGVDYSFRVG
jgi:hypothetical protein